MKKQIIALMLTIPAIAMADGKSSVRAGNYSKSAGVASVAIGMKASAAGNLGTAVGAHSTAGGAMSSAYGSAANSSGESSTAVGKGTLSSGKASAAFGAHATSAGASSLAAGLHAKSEGGQSTAIGQASYAKAEKSTAIGSGAQATEKASTALGLNAKANHAGSVAIGYGSKTQQAAGTKNAKIGNLNIGDFAGYAPQSTVSVGDKGAERTITNVAAGRVSKDSTDAINGSQLFALGEKVSENSRGIEKQQAEIDSLKRSKANKREMRAGIAGAIAMSNLMQPHAAGQTAIAASVGSFKNEAAAAIGLSRISKSGKWGVKASAFVDTRKNWGAGVGVAYFIGGKPEVINQPVIVREVVREVVIREVAEVPKGKKIRQ